MGTARNVLTGVATLGIREPNDSRAEWSQEKVNDGETYSVKLIKKVVSTAAGSACLEIIPVGVTMANWSTDMGSADNYEYWRYWVAGHPAALVNFEQVEFRFEDPDSQGFVEVTCLCAQNQVGNNIWSEYDLGDTQPIVGFYGANEIGTVMNNWGGVLKTNDVQNGAAGIDSVVVAANADDWICTRIRYELYEWTQEREMFIGNIMIHSIEYTVEPGGTAPGMSLGSPYTDIGYTEDGVTLEYTADTADIEVEEETFPIDRVITKETCAITCNMAESSLYNMDKAMAGSLLSGSILKLGAGTMKTLNLRLVGINPAGKPRQIFLPSVTTTGTVAMPYKKGEKTVIPVTFQALKPTGHPAVSIVDATV